ncbi:MAG: hypothetical protein ACT4OJ_04945 [Bacteroidota bacterium]
MERIKSFDEACKQLGIDPATVCNDQDTKDEAAYKRLKVVAKVLNNGWEPNWKDSNEWKYYPWFDLSSGSGLSYYDFVGRYSASSVGSRLCFQTRELAEYAGNQFIDLYTDFFII